MGFRRTDHVSSSSRNDSGFLMISSFHASPIEVRVRPPETMLYSLPRHWETASVLLPHDRKISLGGWMPETRGGWRIPRIPFTEYRLRMLSISFGWTVFPKV